MTEDGHTSKSQKNYEEKSIDDTLKDLDSNVKKGLSPSEVRKRKKKFGSNAIEGKKINPILDFLSQFWGPIPWMLDVMAVLSSVAKRWENMGIFIDRSVCDDRNQDQNHKSPGKIWNCRDRILICYCGIN